MGNSKSIWTKEATKVFVDMMTKDLTLYYSDASRIMSEKFGVTFSKNCCIGKARRLKLPPRPSKHSEERVAAKRVKAFTMPVAPIVEVAKPRIPGMALTIDQLREGDCRFPLWHLQDRSGFYCGSPSLFGTSWCNKHAARVYARPTSFYSAKNSQ